MKQIATFGAGCFWSVEHNFRKINGVLDAVSGYAGGHTATTNYKEVCTDTTGHAEVVQVVFDDEIIDYDTLVKEFFQLHNPTQLNRQGPDYGRQYRSVIFTHNETQKQRAQALKLAESQSGRHKYPVVTTIEDYKNFTRAEEYHQNYIAKTGRVCHI